MAWPLTLLIRLVRYGVLSGKRRTLLNELLFPISRTLWTKPSTSLYLSASFDAFYKVGYCHQCKTGTLLQAISLIVPLQLCCREVLSLVLLPLKDAARYTKTNQAPEKGCLVIKMFNHVLFGHNCPIRINYRISAAMSAFYVLGKLLLFSLYHYTTATTLLSHTWTV